MIQQRWNSFWQDRTVREQRLLLVVAWLIFIGSVFFGVIDPAISGRQYWQHMLP
ncbi:MAG: type II secretion system protein M, partial [Oxalobacteraceae bacterium]|nr:type II secretion system protein M [Oxalobacteraceae bacterium]